MGDKFYILVLLIFVTACTAEGTKIYKVDYKGNYPEGAFRADIGNNTIFTNGQDIIEVHVKIPLDFFCYSVNKEVLCKSNINLKISEEAENRFLKRFNDAESNAIDRNKTIISERILFYMNDEKTEDILTVNDFANQSIESVSMPLIGKGKSDEEAKNDALGRYKQIIAILRDKK